MKQLLTFVLYLSFIVCTHSQSILNTEFEWNKPTNIVICNTPNEKIYLKVEMDPRFTSITKEEFNTKLEEATTQFNLSKNSNGTIKLYILFEDNNQVIVDRIGTKGINLSDHQNKTLSGSITSSGSYNLGSTKGVIQNSYGITYMNIQNGQLANVRNINFGFE